MRTIYREQTLPAPEHYRATWKGTFGATGAGGDIWAFNLAFAPGGTQLSKAQLVTLAGQFRAAYSSSTLAAAMGNHAALTDVRIAKVAATGKVARSVVDGSYEQGDSAPAAPVVGGSTADRHPPQVAVVVSLATATPGATGRGRFYLPGPAVTIGTDGLMSQSTATTLAGYAKTFIDTLNSAATTAGIGRCVVASGGSVLQGISPGLRPVTRVRVGRAADTMRSRRSALLESYSVADLA